MKTILVTGGSRGIGAAVSKIAARTGYRVAVGYATNPEAAQTVVDQIASAGGEAFAVKADVAQRGGHRRHV